MRNIYSQNLFYVFNSLEFFKNVSGKQVATYKLKYSKGGNMKARLFAMVVISTLFNSCGKSSRSQALGLEGESIRSSTLEAICDSLEQSGLPVKCLLNVFEKKNYVDCRTSNLLVAPSLNLISEDIKDENGKYLYTRLEQLVFAKNGRLLNSVTLYNQSKNFHKESIWISKWRYSTSGKIHWGLIDDENTSAAYTITDLGRYSDIDFLGNFVVEINYGFYTGFISVSPFNLEKIEFSTPEIIKSFTQSICGE